MSAPARVLLVGNFLSKTRSIRFVCEDLAEHLSASGREVLTTSSRDSRPVRLADMLATTWARRRSYDVAQVDVYSGSAFFWAEAVCRLLRSLGKPHILTLHGGGLPKFAERPPERVRKLLGGADAVTSPSSFLAEKMSAFRQGIRIIPNPIEISRYPFRERSAARPELVWLRAFHGSYNAPLAPRMLRLLSEKFPAATLTMIGPDKGDGSLELTRKTAEQECVLDRVRFAGGIAKIEIPEALSRADVFINTTNVDNTPVSVVEAMACGLCVVTTSVGGLPHLVTDGENGLLVPPDDPAAMAASVARVLEDPPLAARLSRRGRENAESRDWAKVLPEWDALFESTVSRSGRSGKAA